MEDIKGLKIGIASDHAGFELKAEVIRHLESKGAIMTDFGTNSTESCDYPDFAHPLASAVENGECRYGVAICGTANGISMTVNKHQGCRDAICWCAEIAALARQHNNANVVSLPARFISKNDALDVVDTFFSTDFEGGRHERRVNKIPVK